MKKENDNEKKKGGWKEAAKDKKFYLYTVIGCAVALLSLVIVAVAVSLGEQKTMLKNNDSEVVVPDVPTDQKPDGGEGNEPTGGNVEDMLLPMEGVAVSNEYEFYYNKTLNSYYQHVGLDFAAEAGSGVLAAQSGVIESIYRDELLTGTEITIDHGEGIKSVYRYVDVTNDLKVGDRVERGELIATVAEAVGDEYKDGAHLHFEVLKDGKNVDPANYLTFAEK